MNRWRRKRRVVSSVNPKANLESCEKKVAKNDRNDDVLLVNEKEIRHLAENESNYRE